MTNREECSWYTKNTLLIDERGKYSSATIRSRMRSPLKSRHSLSTHKVSLENATFEKSALEYKRRALGNVTCNDGTPSTRSKKKGFH